MPRILTAFVKLPQKKRTFFGVNGFYLPGRYDIISQVCGQLCRTAGLNVFPERVPAPRMAPFDQGVSEKLKISSISTNTARFCVKKPWNPQRIPMALCLKFCLRLRNIRRSLCFQIHLKCKIRTHSAENQHLARLFEIFFVNTLDRAWFIRYYYKCVS